MTLMIKNGHLITASVEVKSLNLESKSSLESPAFKSKSVNKKKKKKISSSVTTDQSLVHNTQLSGIHIIKVI